MTEINADNLPGDVMAPAAAYLTDQYTNRDIFGVVRGKCTEVAPCNASTMISSSICNVSERLFYSCSARTVVNTGRLLLTTPSVLETLG